MDEYAEILFSSNILGNIHPALTELVNKIFNHSLVSENKELIPLQMDFIRWFGTFEVSSDFVRNNF